MRYAQPVLDTQSITSSMRDYWDNRWYPVDPSYVSTPTAFGVFAHQTIPEGDLPRSYLERLYNIQRWTLFPRGGILPPLRNQRQSQRTLPLSSMA